MPLRRPYQFCHACGNPFPRHILGAKELACMHCGEFTYLNPVPAVNLIIPIDDGIWLVRRGKEPGRGLLGLPGGYMVRGETWRKAGARETKEEIQVQILHPERAVLHHMTESTTAGSEVVIFGIVRRAARMRVGNFRPSEEVLQRRRLRKRDWKSTQSLIAFPLHAAAIDRYFSQHT